MEELTQTQSIGEVRDTIADVVDRATRDEFTIITRRGHPVAAVVPVELLHGFLARERERIAELVARTGQQSSWVPMSAVAAELLDDTGRATDADAA